MEASQALSVESFSYSWLANQNLGLGSPNCSFRVSFDDAAAADGANSFIEMDPNLTPSKRFLVHHEFNFDVPTISQSPMTADKLMSNGVLLPLMKSHDSIHVHSPSSCSTGEESRRFRKSRSLSLRKCNKLPKRIIQKYMELVRPLWCRIRRGRSDSSRVQGVDNWECSSISGLGTSGVDNRRRSCDSESSIHEAVTHCKKTIGMAD